MTSFNANGHLKQAEDAGISTVVQKENPPPPGYKLIEKPVDVVEQRLNTLLDEPLKMCSLLSGCQCICGQDKHSFDQNALFATDSQLHISVNDEFNWLTNKQEQKQLEVTLTQQTSNLVEVERITDCEYNVNFLDETENQCELWHMSK